MDSCKNTIVFFASFKKSKDCQVDYDRWQVADGSSQQTQHKIYCCFTGPASYSQTVISIFNTLENINYNKTIMLITHVADLVDAQNNKFKIKI